MYSVTLESGCLESAVGPQGRCVTSSRLGFHLWKVKVMSPLSVLVTNEIIYRKSLSQCLSFPRSCVFIQWNVIVIKKM